MTQLAPKVTRSILLFLFLSLVVISSISLTLYGKRAAVKVSENLEPFLRPESLDKLTKRITKSLSVNKQILFGIIFSIIVVALSQQAITFKNSGLLVYISVSISVALTGFLVGVGLYLVLCIPQTYTDLLSSKFDVPTLLPYQTTELKRIANISTALSLIGAVIFTLISSLILGLAIESRSYLDAYWSLIMGGVLGSGWITIGIPFVSSQRLISKIIVEAKEENLLRLRISLEKAKRQLGKINNDEKIIQIDKIQNLYEKIYTSPNTILDWGIIGKFLSSLFLSLLPSLIGFLLSR